MPPLYIYNKRRARGSHHILSWCQYSIVFCSLARTPYLDWYLPISSVAKCHSPFNIESCFCPIAAVLCFDWYPSISIAKCRTFHQPFLWNDCFWHMMAATWQPPRREQSSLVRTCHDFSIGGSIFIFIFSSKTQVFFFEFSLALNIHYLHKLCHFEKYSNFWKHCFSNTDAAEFSKLDLSFHSRDVVRDLLARMPPLFLHSLFPWTHGFNNDFIYFGCATRVSKMVELQGGSDSGTASFSGRHCPPLVGFENSPYENSAYIWGRQFPELFWVLEYSGFRELGKIETP